MNFFLHGTSHHPLHPRAALLPRLACRRLGSLFLALVLLAVPGWARSPLDNVMSRLLDETRSELAVGALLDEAIHDEFKCAASASDAALLELCRAIGQRSSRPSLQYNVIIIDAPEVFEIPLPGGTIALGRSTVNAASTPAALEFLLARNVALIAERQPMALIKERGLYAALLREAKSGAGRRQAETVRPLLFRYIEAVTYMNHIAADRLGLAICQRPDAGVAAEGLLQWQQRELAARRPLAVPGIAARLQRLREPVR